MKTEKNYDDFLEKYLDESFTITEIPLPYENKDGRIAFILKSKLQTKEIDEVSGQYAKLLNLVAVRKFNESSKIERTKGIYKTVIDMLKDPSDQGFGAWQKQGSLYLSDLYQSFYVEDSCVSEPKCGDCGRYHIIRKELNQAFINLEQVAIMAYSNFFIFGEKDNEEEQQNFYKFWAYTVSQPFRDDLAKAKIDEGLEDWFVYKDIDKIVKEKFVKFSDI